MYQQQSAFFQLLCPARDVKGNVCCSDRCEGRARKSIPANGQQTLQEKLLSLTVQPLEQGLHSPCAYSKGWSHVWKVRAPFCFKHKEVLFHLAVEKENHRSFLFLQCTLPKAYKAGSTCSCLRSKSAGSSAVHSHDALLSIYVL